MSESTPPGRPKPGSLRDRIAAFEQKPAPAASPPPPRAKPGNLSKWTPKPAEPPSPSQEQPVRHESGMNANDAKASIGAGGSLKERMAALQGLGAFGGPAPTERPRPPVSEKPKWKPPPQVPLSPPIGEDGSEAQPTLPTLPVGIPDEQAVTSPSANQGGGEQPEPSEGAESAVDPEEEERQRRAAIAARMARLGGARVGIGPPVFGKKPTPPPKKLSTDVKDEAAVPIPPTEGTAPKASTSISGTETAAQPANEPPSSVDETDAAAQAGSSASPPSISPSMPVPAVPRRVAPPRRKTPKAPESTPAPTSVGSVNSGATEAEQAPAVLPPVPAEPVVLAKDAVLPTSPEPLESPRGVRGSSLSQQSDTKLDEHNARAVSPITHIEQTNPRPEISPADDDSPSSPHLLASEPSIMHGTLRGTERSASPRGEQFKEDDEEDEETRRKRIAERAASTGGFNPLSSPPAVPEDGSVSGTKLVTPPEDDLSPARPADQDDTESAIGSTTESQKESQVVPSEHEGESAEVVHEDEDTEGEQKRNPEHYSSPTTTDFPVPSPPPMIRKTSSSSMRSYSVTQIGGSQPKGEEREDDDGLDTGAIDFQRDVDEDYERGYVPLSSAPQSAQQRLPTSASSSTYSPLPGPDAAQLERSISSLDEEDDSQALVQQEYGLKEEDQAEQDVVSPPPPRRPTLPPPKRSSLPPTRAVPPPVPVELPQTEDPISSEDGNEASSEKEDIPEPAASTGEMPDERHTTGEVASPTSVPQGAIRPLSAKRTSFPPAHALPPVVPITADSEVRHSSHVRKPSAPRDWTPTFPDIVSPSHGRRTSSDGGNIMSPPPIPSTHPPVPSSRRSVDERRTSLGQSQVVGSPSASPATSPSSGPHPLSPSTPLNAVPVPSRTAATAHQLQPSAWEGAKQGEGEALSDSDGDPIDPRFHSPPPKSPPRPVASKPPQPSISAVPDAPDEEDPEQAQRRTIAERMARLGGIRFGAPPPPNIRSTPARQASMSTSEDVQDSNETKLDHDPPKSQQDTPEVLEDAEEDDQARRARIAARLAASGGMRFGMLPGHAPPAPPTSPPIPAMQGDVESEDEPKSRPARAPVTAPTPPSHPAPAPPPSLRGASAAHSQLVSPSRNAAPLPLDQSTSTSAYDMYEEQQEDDTERVKHEEPEEYEEEIMPPLPPLRPSTRPPIPQTPRRSSVGVASGSQPRRSSSVETASQPHSRRISSQTTEIPSQPNIGLHHPSEYVMVEQDGDTRAAPSSSQSMRRLPPARAPPTQPPNPPGESSQWELPSIPSGGLDFGDASAQSDLSGSFLSEDSTTYPRTDASGPPNQSGTVPKPIPADMSSDDLSVAWGRVGVHMVEAANALLERSKRSLIGNGSYAGFINAVFAQVPQARAPQAGTDYGYLVYAQVGSTVQTRASDIMPGDIIVLQDARLKGHKGLHNYSLSVGEGSPCIGIVSDFETKKAKIRTLQANQHVGQATVETASYRLEDLKSGSIKVYRVLES